MKTIGDRIRDACKRQGVPLSTACERAGVTYKTLHAQIRNNRAIPFETIDRLSQYFNLPMDYFSTYQPTVAVRSSDETSALHHHAAAAYTAALRTAQIDLMRSGLDIGTDDVLNWLAAQNGVLENFDALRERVDLFQMVEPEDSMLKPYRIGRDSLATRFFKLEDEDHYVKTVGSFDQSTINNVLLAHMQASDLRYSISDIDLDVSVGPDRLVGSYRRIMAPVKDRNGQKFMLVHAKMI